MLKVYAWQQKWTEASSVASDIVASGEYRLVDDYGSIFLQGGEFNDESVFEIAFWNASGGDWGFFEEGTLTTYSSDLVALLEDLVLTCRLKTWWMNLKKETLA